MGQSPSTQVEDYSGYDQKPRQRTSHYDRSPSCSSRTSRAIDVGDVGLLTSAQTLRDPQHRSRDVRSRMRHEGNDSNYAFFCMFCDRSFGSNLELEQHLLVHDPAYPFINETTPRPNRLRAASMYSARVRNHTSQPTDSCRVCNKAVSRERLLAHWLLAEAHRNVRGISDLQQTTDRPDLWCALCQTRFTHTDRKRKHMEEMNAHNLHYRELQSQSLRDPNFDRRILEVPRITPPSSPPLPSRNVSQNNSLRATSMYSTRDPSPTCQPSEPCQVCNKPIPGDRLVAHWLLAECHRNVHSASDLHQTTDRPELWCALCRTRFTHSDRKQKHMEEMNAHNLRYRELQSQALRDPNFDRSILEVPRNTRSTSPPAPQNHRNIVVNDGEESIPYCAPCDRYFSTEEDLVQHQSEGRCGSTNEDTLPNPHEVHSSSTLQVPNLPPTMHATRSMPSLRVPSPVVPPVPVLPASVLDSTPATSTATPSRPSSPPPPSYDETIFQIFTAMESLTTPDPHPSSTPAPVGQEQNSGRGTSVREEARPTMPAVPTPPAHECSLCLEREDNLSSLACGHIFGTECIREALQDDSHCPLCRNEASIKDLRRVFLT